MTVHYAGGMNNLSPEPRADVNGKVTTRWVRNNAGVSTKALLCAPPLPPVSEVQPVTAESAPLLASVMKQVFSQRDLIRVEDLHPLAAQRIETMLEEAKREVGSTAVPNPFGFVKSALITTLYELRDETSGQLASARNPLIHDFAVFGANSSGHDTDHLIAGLRKRHEFRKVNDFLLEVPPEGLERAIALYKVTSSIGTRHLDMHLHDEEDKEGYTVEELDEYVMLMNDDLANFVMDNPELTDDVIRVIRERRTDDVELIQSVLSGTARALGEGSL